MLVEIVLFFNRLISARILVQNFARPKEKFLAENFMVQSTNYCSRTLSEKFASAQAHHVLYILLIKLASPKAQYARWNFYNSIG